MAMIRHGARGYAQPFVLASSPAQTSDRNRILCELSERSLAAAWDNGISKTRLLQSKRAALTCSVGAESSRDRRISKKGETYVNTSCDIVTRSFRVEL